MPLEGYPFIPGVPMLPGQEPAGQPTPWLDPTMGMAPQDPTALILSQLMSQPLPGANPRLAQMQAFMQMQQANPPRGPFSALVNPLVSALMARQLGPQLQQQQQQAAMQQRLKT